jgi:hypothetical protein
MVRRHVFGVTALALLGCSSFVAAGCGSSNGTTNQSQTQNDAGEEGSVMPMPEAGGSSSGGDSGSKSDGGGDTDGGHTPSSMYPAFPVDVAQVVNQGGNVLSAPNIVTVTWSSDTGATTWNAFDDAIGASMYWHDINSEYGVGAATNGGHVSITTPPSTQMSDLDLDTLVSTNVANGTWPANTANTIYAVYMDPTSSLYFGGAADAGGQDACASGVGGYHEETQTGSYVYAIMPHCSMFQATDIEDSASHELNEASTDPHPNTSLAYAGFDNDHLSYEFFNAFQDELGDACENYYPWAYYTDSEATFPYAVQRQWSNESAKAGHNPCVPVPSGAFYNVTAFPSEETTINVNLSALGMGAGMVQSKGYKGTLNKPLTIHLGAFSDAPMSTPWDVTANVDMQFSFPDQNGNAINNGTATVTLDKSSVVNGDMITVTITPTAWSSLGVVYVWFKNLLPGASANNPPPHGDYPIIVSEN